MKRRLALALLGLALPCFVLAQAAAQKPAKKPAGAPKAQAPAAKAAPEYKKLEIWLGDWTYEGEAQASPAGPAGKFTGKVSVKPILNGRCVQWQGEDQGPTGTTEWFEVDSYNPATKKFAWNSWSTSGDVQNVAYSIDGANVAYAGTLVTGGKQVRIRGTVVFSDNNAVQVQKGEVSTDGKTWTPYVELKVTKTKTTP